MKLSQLKPNAKNPRKISNDQLARLKESIKQDPEFMVLRPIVYDSSDKNKILGGNMRFKACQSFTADDFKKETGISNSLKEMLLNKEIPDTWTKDGADLTDDKKRRFILADNPIDGMNGEWDNDLLLDEWELPELEDLGFNLHDMGLDTNFEPGTEDDQGRLDELAPKIVTCPHCGEEFDVRKQES